MDKAIRFNNLTTIAALFGILFFVSSGCFAQQKAGDMNIQPYVFEASKEKVDAEMGRLVVPENRKKSDSRLIELAFVRFKSTNPKPGPPIVYLAGGPGGSGIAAARSARFPLFMAMREIADVIALDQRGTGLARPSLNCTETFTAPVDKDLTRAAALELMRAASRACAERLTKQGIDLTGYNTNESADDIDDLRKALGAEKISLWGISYGTHLTLATLKRHEKKIHRVIMAGVEGLEHTIKLPSNVQKHLENLDRLVKMDAELGKDVASLLAMMRDVFDKLEREPVTVRVTDPRTQLERSVVVGKYALQLLTVFSFGGTTGEASIPAGFHAMSKGDFSAAARRWLAFAGGPQTIGSGMSNMMDCYSGITAARKKRVAAEAKTTLLGDIMDFPMLDVCDAWGSPDLGDEFRKNVRTNVPTLFISGTLDVRTPPSNAEEVRRGFTNSEHLIIDGAVHSDPLFLSSPKIKDVMLEFMRGDKISTTAITLPPLKFLPISR